MDEGYAQGANQLRALHEDRSIDEPGVRGHVAADPGGREHQHLDPLGERRPERDVVASVMPFEGLKTTEKLRDLGEVNSAWAGIYSPCYSDATVARYIQRQFLEDANVYLERYQATGYWRGLLSAAQQFYSLKRGPTPPRIFDLGSGGGNTVLPLLELYPEAQVVASDLSLPLLKALRATLAERYPSHRFCVLQQNAERLLFADRQFDLVVGGAVLHHLRSPARALAECARVLRPHGVALFFEPFLGGNRIVAATFQALLDLDQGRPPRPSRRLPKGVASFIQRLKVLPPGSAGLVPDVAQCLTGVCRDFAIRASMNRLTVRLRRVDDKWLFERRFFASAAREARVPRARRLSPEGEPEALLRAHAVAAASGVRQGRRTPPAVGLGGRGRSGRSPHCGDTTGESHRVWNRPHEEVTCFRATGLAAPATAGLRQPPRFGLVPQSARQQASANRGRPERSTRTASTVGRALRLGAPVFRKGPPRKHGSLPRDEHRA